jgi:hypothetical protein
LKARPIGVRMVSTITASGISGASLGISANRRHTGREPTGSVDQTGHRLIDWSVNLL